MSIEEQEQVAVSTVATFPPGYFLENITTLPDDTVLVTVANRKCIYAIPPSAIPGQPRQPILLHQFADDAWAFGITTSESNPDITYMLTTDFTSQGSCTHHLRFLDISNVAAACHLETLIEFPSAARGLNGLTPLSDTVLLAADSFAGCIWRIDIRLTANGRPCNASVTQWMKHPAFEGKLVLPDFQPGVNGLKYSKVLQTLVFSSTQKRLLGTIAVDPQTLQPIVPVRIIHLGAQGDDLIIDDHFEGGPVAYLATHRDNSIIRVPIQGEERNGPVGAVGATTIVEASQKDQRVLGPTSGVWKWGQEGRTAYFNCDGGLKNPFNGLPPQFARVLQVDFWPWHRIV